MIILILHILAKVSAVSTDGQFVSAGLVVNLEVAVLGRFGDSVPSGDPEQSSHSIFSERVNLVQSWNGDHDNLKKNDTKIKCVDISMFYENWPAY